MRSVLFIACPIVLGFSLLGGVAQLWSSIERDRAADAFHDYREAVSLARGGSPLIKEVSSGDDSTGEPSRVRSLKYERTLALESAESAAHVPFSSFRLETQRASLLRLLAEQEPDQQARIFRYCAALAGFGSALESRPGDAHALMSWANLRQLLGSVKCEGPYTEGSYQAAIVRALETDPTNNDTRYAAALILLWGGEKGEAHRLLHEVLRYGTNLTESQLKAIYLHLDSAETLLEMVPARFPQVFHVSKYFHDQGLLTVDGDVTVPQGSPGSKKFTLALRALQLRAIEESVESFERNEIPFDLHLSRLRGLNDFTATDDTRAVLDHELATLVEHRGQRELAEYLTQRSSLSQLKIVSSTAGGETRPLKAPLTHWGTPERVVLDDFYRTVGFYLGEGQSAQTVELAIPTIPSSTAMSAFKIFVSEDNSNWDEITSQVKFSRLEFGTYWLIAARLKPKSHRFWKVHFASPARDKQLVLDIPNGVKVYGTSAR